MNVACTCFKTGLWYTWMLDNGMLHEYNVGTREYLVSVDVYLSCGDVMVSTGIDGMSIASRDA